MGIYFIFHTGKKSNVSFHASCYALIDSSLIRAVMVGGEGAGQEGV